MTARLRNVLIGPAACHGCGAHVYYAQSYAMKTRNPTRRWRDVDGPIHRCPTPKVCLRCKRTRPGDNFRVVSRGAIRICEECQSNHPMTVIEKRESHRLSQALWRRKVA